MQYSNTQKKPTGRHAPLKTGTDRNDTFRPEFSVVSAGEPGDKGIDTHAQNLATFEASTTLRPWTETQALAERAARGAEVPFAQSAWFGAAAARHLATGRNPDDLSFVLAAPDALIKLSVAIERVVEKASMGVTEHRIDETPLDLVLSYLESMPCAVETRLGVSGLVVRINLAELTTRDRPADVPVPDALWSRMEQLARLSLVPNSAASRDKEAGADLMKFD